AFLLGALVLGLGIGPVSLGAGPIVESALSHLPFLHVHSPLNQAQEAILWQLRAPRVVLGALVGGMLAIAGSAYQGVFRNPLADPAGGLLVAARRPRDGGVARRRARRAVRRRQLDPDPAAPARARRPQRGGRGGGRARARRASRAAADRGRGHRRHRGSGSR